MSMARLVITAVIVEGRSQADVARAYGVAESRVSKLVARYRTDGDTGSSTMHHLTEMFGGSFA
jgi:transposase